MSRADEIANLDIATRERLRFLGDSHHLSSVARKNVVLDASRPENSAEHSWHLVLCATILAPSAAPGVDLAHVLKMLAVHDLPEILVGDTPSYEAELRAQAAHRERDAAPVVFGVMPESDDLLALWREFDDCQTDEARFAHAIDRLQPILLHWAGGGTVWRSSGRPRSTVQSLADLIAELWPPLGDMAAALVDDATRLGDLVDDRIE